MEIENLLNTQSPAVALDDSRLRRTSKSPAEKSNASNDMSAVATTPQQPQYAAPTFSSPYQTHATPYHHYATDAHHPDYAQYHPAQQMLPADAARLQDAQHHTYGSNAQVSPPEAQGSAQANPAPYFPDDTVKARPLACSTCGKGFARRSDLVRHERIHSNDRPHTCRECGKQFIQRSALTVHERVHSGQKPHVCEKCNKPFSDSSSLARHRRIHTGKRPYKCHFEGCGKTFTRRTTLTRHQNSHLPDGGHPASRTAAAALNAQGGTPDSAPSHPENDRTNHWASGSTSQSPGSRAHNSTSAQAWSTSGAVTVSDPSSQHYAPAQSAIPNYSTAPPTEPHFAPVQPAERAYSPNQRAPATKANQRSLRSGRRAAPFSAEQAVMTSEQAQAALAHEQNGTGPGPEGKAAHFDSYDNSQLQYHAAYDPNYIQGQAAPYYHHPDTAHY